MNGLLFFGSTTQFSNLFDVKNDPGDIVMDFPSSRVIDHSALESIHCISDSLFKKLHYGNRPYELI